jgi:hypothetical protein
VRETNSRAFKKVQGRLKQIQEHVKTFQERLLQQIALKGFFFTQ